MAEGRQGIIKSVSSEGIKSDRGFLDGVLLSFETKGDMHFVWVSIELAKELGFVFDEPHTPYVALNEFFKGKKLLIAVE